MRQVKDSPAHHSYQQSLLYHTKPTSLIFVPCQALWDIWALNSSSMVQFSFHVPETEAQQTEQLRSTQFLKGTGT